MTEIPPTLSATEIARVRQETDRYLALAETLWGRAFPAIEVVFDLRGRAAGMYRVRGDGRVIRYNPWLFARYFADNLATTVPHEVAHYLCDLLYGLGRIKPHGEEWRTVMARLGASPQVTCRYDIQGLPIRRERRVRYRCACREHWLTMRRHNQVQRGRARYTCTQCRGWLAPASNG